MIKTAVLSLFVALSGTQPLDDPKEEARAQALMREIRCVACENEPVSQSSANIASDMRIRIRTLVAEGKTDQEVRAWFVERYGEFVLFRPDAKGVSGTLLWGLPFLILIGGAAIVFVRRKPSKKSSIESINPEDA